MSKTANLVSWALQAIAAIILLQTLFFKFTGASESVYIFESLGVEPWGRIGTGVVELIAAVLLLIPRTTVYGAGIAFFVISGAILSHLVYLGITLPSVNDKGELFALAVATFACAAGVLIIHRREIPLLGTRL
ncbi:MAG: DoxX family protein [Acidobacteria bacterium]|nr:DoxX family protein [Acidobacteriota bacterium]